MEQQERYEQIVLCKRRIRERAAFTMTNYREEDLVVWEEVGGTVVCICQFPYPWIKIEDDGTVTVLDEDNSPNIWTQLTDLVWAEAEKNSFKYKILIHPIHVLRPDLVFIILPDGTIKDGSEKDFLQECYTQSMQSRALSMWTQIREDLREQG